MIGITEAGDPSICHEWIDKVNTVKGVILITKNPGSFINSHLEDEIEKIKDKLIIHCSITGYGKSVVEPNVSPHIVSVMMMVELIKRGYNIVLRIDPIIPTVRGFDRVKSVIEYTKIHLGSLNNLRIRWSLIDNYKHIKARDINLPWNSFHVPEVSSDPENWLGANDIINYFSHLEETESCIIECCAEQYTNIPKHWIVGCVSIKDLGIMGIPSPVYCTKSNQRKACRCISLKKELLNTKKQCAYSCKYCYWRDDESTKITNPNTNE